MVCCNREGLLKFLEGQQSELEVRAAGGWRFGWAVDHCSSCVNLSPTPFIFSTANNPPPPPLTKPPPPQVCEKALADYMESKRRSFPRFYFVSTADLLDILSNGNSPHKVGAGVGRSAGWAVAWVAASSPRSRGS